MGIYWNCDSNGDFVWIGGRLNKLKVAIYCLMIASLTILAYKYDITVLIFIAIGILVL